MCGAALALLRGVGTCGEDAEITAGEYERWCEGTFALPALTAYVTAAGTLAIVVSIGVLVAHRTLRPLTVSVAALAVAVVVLFLIGP